jgi:hypothetical protein
VSIDSSVPSAPHRWRFFRIGGFDQVRIETAADLINLRQLDPKLWVALSCPVKGAEFDAGTLALLDSDKDGHIRVPEILAAAEWVGKVLKDPSALASADSTVPLAAFNEADDEGRLLLASARRVLASNGKPDATHIDAADTADIGAIYTRMHHNGDGLITTLLVAADDTATLDAIIATLGSENDRSSLPGVDETRITTFFDEATALIAWHAQGQADAAIRALGENTSAAAASFRAARAKVDDFFTRSRLASFDARAAALLNPTDNAYGALNPEMLSNARSEIAALPLAQVNADATLSLTAGINPAWQAVIAALRNDVITPVLGERENLSLADWEKICATFDAHEQWQAAKPQTVLEPLGIDTLRTHATAERRERLLALVAADKAAAPEADAVATLDKLLRYCRDLMLFTNNFVSFRDFYTGRNAIFQAGALYLDGRTCNLTVKVLDAGKHAALATLSGVCLVYCDCSRGAEKMQITAAFTDGDADQLMVGRNGVFWDRSGKDWNATITKIVEHPISIRQAFWTPYRRIGRFVGEQMNKFAATKTDAMDKQLASGVESGAGNITAPPPAKPPAPPAPFDIAKFAGIFAALGLAVGAIGTAIAAILTGFLALKAWQMPLVVVGAMLLVSGPSMLLAFLKLRKRNLGPILDANGWAVNARARINIPFGTSLTRLAVLPASAERSLIDPYAEKKPVWPWFLLAASAVVAGWFAWKQFGG